MSNSHNNDSSDDPTTVPATPVDTPRIIKPKRLRDFAKFTLISHNVNGLKQPEKLEILSRQLITDSIDVMCLQETWRDGKFTVDIPTKDNNTCTFIHYGPDTQTSSRGSGGVGFLLGPEGRKAWILAGSHPPDYSPPLNNTCRAMGIRLTFVDNRKNKINYYVISS
mmetsp:Transcript_13948/g.19962  ORF Transcript_13948/g.19962 Transcript_13948/m.19962 type:complete len:166 (-) Transcript_13948:9-506(-)